MTEEGEVNVIFYEDGKSIFALALNYAPNLLPGTRVHLESKVLEASSWRADTALEKTPYDILAVRQSFQLRFAVTCRQIHLIEVDVMKGYE